MKRRMRMRHQAAAVACAAVSILAAISGCDRMDKERSGPAAAVGQSAGEWRVQLTNRPDPPRVGDNDLTVEIRDLGGAPLRGRLEVVITMESMGTMSRMESRGVVRPVGPGRFRARYGLAMSGDWDLSLRILPDSGSPAEARYRLSTTLRGLAFAGGTPPTFAAIPESGAIAGARGDGDVPGAVQIEPARWRALGILTERVQVRPLVAAVRAPGRVVFDEVRRADVTLRVDGFVRDVRVGVTGQAVRKGDVLMTVYSPALWSAQQEYLESRRAARADSGGAALGDASRDLVAAARTRLRLWGVGEDDLAELDRTGRAREAVPIRAPMAGVVAEKNVVLGSAFVTGQVLYRIAGLDPVWVIASVPQSDLSQVRVGAPARVRDPNHDRPARRGTISFVSPSLDSLTRTGEVRIQLPNPGGALRPGAYLEVELGTAEVRALAVPESAVLATGERHMVFVDLGDGRFGPREVQLGRRAGGYYEVLGGLTAGEAVVTSGNFLVAAESRLRSGGPSW
jgi:Cu(I)/Ag(I) efflux system membrane fusion protein